MLVISLGYGQPEHHCRVCWIQVTLELELKTAKLFVFQTTIDRRTSLPSS
jgi:hypothetical protein